jgi:hypothetical protein
MTLLHEEGVENVYHYTPLHYISFIGRDQTILSKPSLENKGFSKSHLRSKSYRQDILRGFGDYAFLTIDTTPRILDAKLKAGFPHIGISVPSGAIDECDYRLCRYNVAMTRYLKRGNNHGFPESSSNGRYYDNHQIPVALTPSDKRELLRKHLGKSMIEVLINGDLPLPANTTIDVYRSVDQILVESILENLEIKWDVELKPPPSFYANNASYDASVKIFVEQALSDPDWRGDGLEFDRV